MNRAERRMHAKAERRVLTSPHWRRELNRRVSADRREYLGAELDVGQQLDLATPATGAVNLIADGAATGDDLATITVALDIALHLAGAGIGSEAADVLRAGLDAVLSVTEREQRTGRAVATGPELTAIREAIALHVEQLALQPTRAQMFAALGAARQRMETSA